MRKVELALLVFGLTLTAGGRARSEGCDCPEKSALRNVEKRVSDMETRMTHCLDRLVTLGEFEKVVESDLTLLNERVKEIRGRLSSENAVMADRPDPGSDSEENVTSLMRMIDEEKRTVENLGGQIRALKDQKNLLKMDLESEKKHRRSLAERLEKMDRRLRETGSWKASVEDIRLRLDNLSEPTNDMTFRLSLLLEERDGLKSEIENGKTVLKNLEAHIYSLEKELNETNNLKDDVDHLLGKMDQLQSNITDETVNRVKRMIEVRLSDMDQNDEKTMEEKLKVLEYQLEDRQNNMSTLINRTLNSRVSKVERLLSALGSEGNKPWKEEMARMKETVDVWINVTVRLGADLEATRENASEVEAAVREGISSVSFRLREMEKEGTKLFESLRKWNEWRNDSESDAEELRRKLENLDREMEELGEKIDFLGETRLNASSRPSWISRWEEDVSETRRNLSRLEEDVKELSEKTSDEWSDAKRELDQVNLNLLDLMDLSDDRRRNASETDLRLKRIEGTWSGYVDRLRKVENALSKTATAEDSARHDEKIVRLLVDVGKLKGRTEDSDRKLDGWNAKIAEAKNWVAEHVDREQKKLEKRIFRDREDSKRQFERSMEEKIDEFESKMEKTLNVHRESITYLLNRSKSSDDEVSFTLVANVSDEESSCAVVPDWDAELVVSYKRRPLKPGTRRISEGEALVFRCSHVGRYFLSGPERIVCRRGLWSSRPPFCRKLADEEDVVNLRNVETFCQSSGNGRHLYPFDCKQYYNCMEDTFRIQRCPSDLYFDEKSKSCVRQISSCIDYPAIDFSPLPGTSDVPVGVTQNGTLVLHPGQNLILNCIRPVELGPVWWKIKTEGLTKTRTSVTHGDKSHRLELKNVDRSDSGTYSCVETEEAENRGGIRVLVEAVVCPEMEVRSPLTVRNSTSRRLASRIRFSCPADHTLEGPDSVVCLADGDWSDRAPVCRRKGCLRPDTTDDPWIELSPDESFYSVDAKVMLTCGRDAPATLLIGVVRCSKNETWNVFPFPSCC